MEKRLIYELATSLAESYKHPKIDELNQKMSYLVDKNKSHSPYFFDLTLWQTKELFLTDMEEAIEKSQVLSFEYTDIKGATTFRQVEPINLVSKSHEWYLFGFCQLRQDTRLFRISRIRRITLLEERFDPLNHESLGKSEIDFFYTNLAETVDMIPVALEFKLDAKTKVYDSFLEKEIILLENKLIVQKELPKERWLIEMLLSFGSTVRVISPDWLKEEIIKETKIILNQYDIQ